MRRRASLPCNKNSARSYRDQRSHKSERK
jgi:hypothetical protein